MLALTPLPRHPRMCPAGALTDLANAVLLRDQGASHPLPGHIAGLPNVRPPPIPDPDDIRALLAFGP